MMRLLLLPLQVLAILFLPTIIRGNQNEVDELKKGHFLCEISSSKAFCLKTKQLCDTSTGNARCICKEGWKGSRCHELIDEPVSIPPTGMPTFPRVGGTCTESSDCVEVNSNCLEGVCRCDSGYIPRKGNCINIDECKDPLNECGRNSECHDTDGSYECTCKDGFHDSNPSLPGRKCQQTNECKIGTHNCDAATQVCIDRRPPEKWECVEKTPAPTPKPTQKPTPYPNKIVTCLGNQIVTIPEGWCYCYVKTDVSPVPSQSSFCGSSTYPYMYFVVSQSECAQNGSAVCEI